MKWVITMCWLVSLASLSAGQATEQGSDWGLDAGKGETVTESADGLDEESASSGILDKIHKIAGPDQRKYGVRNGCVQVNRIRNIRFKDDQVAVVDLGRDKKLLLRLRKECEGIKNDGFKYESRNGQICARFSQFIVIGRSARCTLESITPYIDLESVKSDETPA